MSENKNSKQHPELISAFYQAIANRRLGYDTLLWQVPAISFTAQAFLFNIALSSTNHLAQILSAFLALVIACISMQLMSKHRYHEEIDARLLEKFEKEYQLGTSFGCPPHAKPSLRSNAVGKSTNWFVKQSSYQLWMFGLMLFALTALSIIIITVIDILTNLKLLT